MKVYVLEESAALLSASLSLCLVGEPDPKAAQLPLRILHRARSLKGLVRPLTWRSEEGRARERPSVTCRTVGLGGFCFRWRRMVVCHDECPRSRRLDRDSLRCVSLSKSFTECSADSRQDYYLLQCVRQTVYPLYALIFDASTHRYARIP